MSILGMIIICNLYFYFICLAIIMCKPKELQD